MGLALACGSPIFDQIHCFADEKVLAPNSRVLSGGIVHSEQLAPLPPGLQPGKQFAGIESLDPSGMHRSELAPSQTSGPAVNTPGSVSSPAAPQPLQSGSGKKTLGQTFSLSQYPKQGNVKTVSNFQKNQAQMNSQISAQFKDYMKQQAKLGNRGTVGLQNFLDAKKDNGTLTKHMVGRAGQSNGQSNGQANKPATKAPLVQFIIPNWLAGVWSRTESNEVSRTELPAGRKVKPVGKTVAKVMDSFGNARDAKGEIWQVFDPTKASGSVDRGQAIDYHNVSYYNITKLADKKALVKVRATHVVVNKKTRRIVTAYQDEEFNTYTEITPTLLRTDSSVKVFDTKGKPTLLTTATSTESKLR